MLGKVREAQNSIMTLDYDYDTFKTAVLKAFQLTPEAYRQKVQKHKQSESESIKAYVSKLSHSFECWVKYFKVSPDDTKGITQIIIREQVLERVSGDLRKYIMDKNILDTTELAKETEIYASSRPNYWKRSKLPQGQFGNNNHQKKAESSHKVQRPHPYNSNGQSSVPHNRNGQSYAPYNRNGQNGVVKDVVYKATTGKAK